MIKQLRINQLINLADSKAAPSIYIHYIEKRLYIKKKHKQVLPIRRFVGYINIKPYTQHII